MGILIGGLSSLFVRLLVYFSACLKDRPVWLRMVLAGACTGSLALAVPQIMGIGYDTVNEILLGNLGLGVMLALLVCKLLATALGLGLGLPGGVIGPTLVMGAVTGGAVGVILNLYVSGPISPSFYAMLGMGAVMAAVRSLLGGLPSVAVGAAVGVPVYVGALYAIGVDPRDRLVVRELLGRYRAFLAGRPG
jgi:H+/Cl- antiporter ClcA